MTKLARQIIETTRTYCATFSALKFAPPVYTTYNPLHYAAKSYETYVSRFAANTKRVLFLGMNPGPWGMAQTGVPFGEVAAVRDWMGISTQVDRPVGEHPKRPISGFACPRSEVSGRRLWGLMSERYGVAKRFFEEHFVANYCPLIFLEESGRNRTPEKLTAEERATLYDVCDRLLIDMIEVLQSEWFVGVGKFAEKRLLEIAVKTDIDPGRITSIAHPSPANPAANRGWAPLATSQLIESGVWREEHLK